MPNCLQSTCLAVQNIPQKYYTICVHSRRILMDCTQRTCIHNTWSRIRRVCIQSTLYDELGVFFLYACMLFIYLIK